MKRIILLLPVLFSLSACVAQTSLNPALTNCPKQTWWFCRGKPNTPEVNINTQSAKLKARPYCVNAAEGSTIKFKLTPPGNAAPGTVAIVPKKASHTWLSATNSANQDEILITVPTDLPEGERYLYGITFGSKCVHPRVNVKN